MYYCEQTLPKVLVQPGKSFGEVYMRLKSALDAIDAVNLTLEQFISIVPTHFEILFLPFLKIRSVFPSTEAFYQLYRIPKVSVHWKISFKSLFTASIFTSGQMKKHKFPSAYELVHVKPSIPVQYSYSPLVSDRVYHICPKCWRCTNDSINDECNRPILSLQALIYFQKVSYSCSISVLRNILFILYNNEEVLIPIANSNLKYDGNFITASIGKSTAYIKCENEYDCSLLMEEYENNLSIKTYPEDVETKSLISSIDDVSLIIGKKPSLDYALLKRYDINVALFNREKFLNVIKFSKILNHPNIMGVTGVYMDTKYAYIGKPIIRISADRKIT